MYIENLTWTDVELNTTSGIFKQIKDIAFSRGGTNYGYRPFGMAVDNRSGYEVHVNFMTAVEYAQYQTSGTITQYYPVLNNANTQFTNPRGEISWVGVAGSVASHTSGVVVTIIKESNV